MCVSARPLDEILFKIAQQPAGLSSGRTAFFVSFAAVGKSDSLCQGLASKKSTGSIFHKHRCLVRARRVNPRDGMNKNGMDART